MHNDQKNEQILSYLSAMPCNTVVLNVNACCTTFHFLLICLEINKGKRHSRKLKKWTQLFILIKSVFFFIHFDSNVNVYLTVSLRPMGIWCEIMMIKLWWAEADHSNFLQILDIILPQLHLNIIIWPLITEQISLT